GEGYSLAFGAELEASNATGVYGDQANNSLSNAGAVYVFARSGVTWSQQAYVKASNTGAGDKFGSLLTLSADGNALAVGANAEASNATGLDGDQANNSAAAAGAVYVLSRSGATWSQQAYVKASNAQALDYFGTSVSLAGDGNTLAVGAWLEDSNATGIGGNQGDNSADSAGAAYVY
ncbi:MAG: FG-GAP repeat protein, partial [Ramlibacter sp.]